MRIEVLPDTVDIVGGDVGASAAAWGDVEFA